jgi:hypothetical protein
MDLSEFSVHSFVIRIWLEETPDEAGRAKWRGRIVHVTSGTERYFEGFDEIALFVGACLDQSIASVRQEAPKRKRSWQWLLNWMRRSNRR